MIDENPEGIYRGSVVLGGHIAELVTIKTQDTVIFLEES